MHLISTYWVSWGTAWLSVHEQHQWVLTTDFHSVITPQDMSGVVNNHSALPSCYLEDTALSIDSSNQNSSTFLAATKGQDILQRDCKTVTNNHIIIKHSWPRNFSIPNVKTCNAEIGSISCEPIYLTLFPFNQTICKFLNFPKSLTSSRPLNTTKVGSRKSC